MTIYFIEMENEGWIKVGYTAGSAERRMAQLQTGQPQKLKLLGTISGEMDGEKGLHTELRAYRGNGEWFRSTPELLLAISFLIEHQHPWYFIRSVNLSATRREIMEEAWTTAFSKSLDDQTSFDVPFLHETSNDNHETVKKIRNLGVQISRNSGTFPSWVKRRIDKLNISPAQKYIVAWNYTAN